MNKTYKRGATFNTVVSQEEAEDGRVEIVITNTIPSGEFYFIGQVRRGLIDISGFSWDYDSQSGILVVLSTELNQLVEGDTINVMGSWNNV